MSDKKLSYVIDSDQLYTVSPGTWINKVKKGLKIFFCYYVYYQH